MLISIVCFLAVSTVFLLVRVFKLTKSVKNFKGKVEAQDAEMKEMKRRHRVELIKAALEYQERERKKISAEVHDGINPNLASIKIITDLMLSGGVACEERNLSEIRALVLETMETAEGLSKDLSTNNVRRIGLVEAVRELCYRNKIFRKSIDFSESGFIHKITDERGIQIYRIVQEVLNNYVKHSDGTHMIVQMLGGPILIISIVDNGKPFEYSFENIGSRIGLTSIQSRLDSLSATLVSEAGKPNKTEIYVPLQTSVEVFQPQLWL